MKKFKIRTQELADLLNVPFTGADLEANIICPIDSIKPGALSFSKHPNISNLPDCGALIIAPLDTVVPAENTNNGYVLTGNPRLSFAIALNKLLYEKKQSKIHTTAIIGEDTEIGDNVHIGAYSSIGNNCIIGSGVEIRNNVVIYDNSIIGENCLLKSGAKIGEEGFGFDFDENATPIRFPHIGNVVLGKEVEVGSNAVIARGAIKETVVGDYVKIDDLVFIAHNCNIGEKTIITACVELSGSIEIGARCWIGPNVSIIQKVKIGNDVKIGIGAVVSRDINDGETVMGFSAIPLKKLAKAKRLLNLN